MNIFYALVKNPVARRRRNFPSMFFYVEQKNRDRSKTMRYNASNVEYSGIIFSLNHRFFQHGGTTREASALFQHDRNTNGNI